MNDATLAAFVAGYGVLSLGLGVLLGKAAALKDKTVVYQDGYRDGVGDANLYRGVVLNDEELAGVIAEMEREFGAVAE